VRIESPRSRRSKRIREIWGLVRPFRVSDRRFHTASSAVPAALQARRRAALGSKIRFGEYFENGRMYARGWWSNYRTARSDHSPNCRETVGSMCAAGPSQIPRTTSTRIAHLLRGHAGRSEGFPLDVYYRLLNLHLDWSEKRFAIIPSLPPSRG